MVHAIRNTRPSMSHTQHKRLLHIRNTHVHGTCHTQHTSTVCPIRNTNVCSAYATHTSTVLLYASSQRTGLPHSCALYTLNIIPKSLSGLHHSCALYTINTFCALHPIHPIHHSCAPFFRARSPCTSPCTWLERRHSPTQGLDSGWSEWLERVIG